MYKKYVGFICLLGNYVRQSVGWFVVWSVCHNFLKEREISHPCSYRSSCFDMMESLSKQDLKDLQMRRLSLYRPNMVFSSLILADLREVLGGKLEGEERGV